MVASTLEHKISGPGDFAKNVQLFRHWDSVREMSSIRAGKPLDEKIDLTDSRPEEMQGIWLYGSDAVAYSIQNEEHILELYDANDPAHIPDKATFISTLRRGNDYRRELPELEDESRRINLSDEQFNKNVTPQNNSDYSYITFDISDIAGGKETFEEKYGTEATKLFTALHGEDVYDTEGIKGRFKEGLESTRILFLNEEVTEEKLTGGEYEGMKLLWGAYLDGLDDGSDVYLDDRFSNGYAHVSGVMEKAA